MTPAVFVSGVESVSVAVTGPAVAVCPFTVAVLLITPASTSACFTVYVAVHVTVASGASEVTPPQSIADRPGSGSVITNDVIVTLPVFVTTKLKVTTSPTLVDAVAFELLTSVTPGVFVSGVASVLSAATAPAGGLAVDRRRVVDHAGVHVRLLDRVGRRARRRSGSAPATSRHAQSTADSPGSRSVTTNDVIVTLPVFVTTKLKVTTSPALVAAVAFELLTIVTPGAFVAVAISLSVFEVTGHVARVEPGRGRVVDDLARVEVGLRHRVARGAGRRLVRGQDRLAAGRGRADVVVRDRQPVHGHVPRVRDQVAVRGRPRRRRRTGSRR